MNTPEANSISVAERTAALVAGISKQFIFMDSVEKPIIHRFIYHLLNLPGNFVGERLFGLLKKRGNKN